jgi:methionyl-tRNA formyltransferase
MISVLFGTQEFSRFVLNKLYRCFVRLIKVYIFLVS